MQAKHLRPGRNVPGPGWYGDGASSFAKAVAPGRGTWSSSLVEQHVTVDAMHRPVLTAKTSLGDPGKFTPRNHELGVMANRHDHASVGMRSALPQRPIIERPHLSAFCTKL